MVDYIGNGRVPKNHFLLVVDHYINKRISTETVHSCWNLQLHQMWVNFIRSSFKSVNVIISHCSLVCSTQIASETSDLFSGSNTTHVLQYWRVHHFCWFHNSSWCWFVYLTCSDCEGWTLSHHAHSLHSTIERTELVMCDITTGKNSLTNLFLQLICMISNRTIRAGRW